MQKGWLIPQGKVYANVDVPARSLQRGQVVAKNGHKQEKTKYHVSCERVQK